MSEESQVRRLRRHYARQGTRLRKIPERSRWYAQYGPFMLVDDYTNSVTAWGLTLEELLESE